MAGRVIASVMVEEEDTSPVAETAGDVLIQAIVDVGHQQAIEAVTGPTVVPSHIAPMPEQRVVACPMVAPTPQPRVVACPMVALADRMMAAITTSR